jgi:hypothetical protein
VPGRVGEDPEALAARAQPGRAQLEGAGLDGVEVVDEDVEVRLLRVRRVRPAGRVVPAHLLEHHAFTSGRSDLVAGDTNGAADVFVRDQRTGTLRRVSVSSSGAQADGSSLDADLSADGRFVSFLSDATNLVPHDTNDAQDAFLRGPLPVS